MDTVTTMKKLTAILLVLALVTLVACGSKAPTGTADDGVPAATGPIDNSELDDLEGDLDQAGSDVLDVSSLDSLESDLSDMPVE